MLSLFLCFSLYLSISLRNCQKFYWLFVVFFCRKHLNIMTQFVKCWKSKFHRLGVVKILKWVQIGVISIGVFLIESPYKLWTFQFLRGETYCYSHGSGRQLISINYQVHFCLCLSISSPKSEKLSFVRLSLFMCNIFFSLLRA